MMDKAGKEWQAWCVEARGYGVSKMLLMGAPMRTTHCEGATGALSVPYLTSFSSLFSSPPIPSIRQHVPMMIPSYGPSWSVRLL